VKNRYKIYPDNHFGVLKFSPGLKSIEEILKLAEQFRKDKDFPKVHYQITDVRDCLFDFTSDKIGEVKALMEKYEDIDNQKLGVYLVDQPMETAIVSIFCSALEYQREICSTVGKAYNLLPLPVRFDDFERMVAI
jgi:hypothetical protein